MKQTFFAILTAGILLPGAVCAFTEHSGELQRDEVWTAVGSPHVLRSTTEVPAGIRLIIEPGAVVAASENAQFIVSGRLDILGTPDRRVLITGLDQNQWGGMVFAENSEANLNNVTFATSSSILMRVISASLVRMCGDSLQFSPVSDEAVGLSVEGGHVEVVCGAVISPMAELYSISLEPARHTDPIQVGGQGLPARGIDVLRGATGLAATFALEQNYPNPFNPRTTIRYNVPRATHVLLTVYDVSGSEMRRLVDAEQAEGSYAVDFLATDMPSGMYFYRLQAGNFVDQKTMLLVK